MPKVKSVKRSTKNVNGKPYIWAITWYPHEQPRDKVQRFCKMYAKHYIYQLERGEKKKKLHYQIFVNLRTAVNGSRMNNIINTAELNGAEYSPASCAGKEALKTYCMKEDTRVEGPWMDKKTEEKKKWTYNEEDLLTTYYPWQQQVIEMIRQPVHPSIIYWFYDREGGFGKSAFGKDCAYRLHMPLITAAKASDILNLVSKMPNRPGYIFNIVRTINASVMDELYCAMETIKDGCFINTKYETFQVIMNKPHIIVFSNHLPKMSALSARRWCIVDMEKVFDRPPLESDLHKPFSFGIKKIKKI